MSPGGGVWRSQALVQIAPDNYSYRELSYNLRTDYDGIMTCRAIRMSYQ